MVSLDFIRRWRDIRFIKLFGGGVIDFFLEMISCGGVFVFYDL